jgi:hypothetical protein
VLSSWSGGSQRRVVGRSSTRQSRSALTTSGEAAGAAGRDRRDTVGIYVRGFAAGATLSKALDELERRLERRLVYARDRVRSRAGLRPGFPRSLLAGPRHCGPPGASIGR